MATTLLNNLLTNLNQEVEPRQKPFNLQSFLTDSGQMANFIAKQEERQRQNSLRNLIRKREEEGIGYDQLSNEAAKYDMNIANTMRNEFRDSYKFNRQESDVELQRFKREMADYWFGEVLRRAQAEGYNPEQLKNICFEAAGLIAPYDSDLAYKLLRDTETMYGADAKRRNDLEKKNKPLKDDTDLINQNRKKYSEAAQDFDKNPKQYRENRIMMSIDDALRAWKMRGEHDNEKYPHYKGWSRPLWTPMETALLQAVKERFPKYNVSNIEFEKARKWLEGLTDDDANIIFGYIMMENQNLGNSIEDSNVDSPVIGNVRKDKSSQDDENADMRLPKTLISYNGDTGAKRVNDQNVAKLNALIPYLFTKEDFQAAYKLASELSGLESGENTAYKDVKSQIDRQYKLIQEEKQALKDNGFSVPEKDFNKFKDLFGTRASMSIIRQMMNFNSFVEGYYNESPMTVIVNGLLVGEPNYKPTVEEFNQAKELHSENLSDNIKSIMRKMNIPILSQWADYASSYPALFSTAKAAVNQARSVWNLITQDLSEEDKKEVTKMFKLGKDAMKLLEKNKNGKYGRLAYNQEEYDKERKLRNKRYDEEEELSTISNDSTTAKDVIEGGF